MKKLRILCLEDNVSDAEILERELRKSDLDFSIEFIDGKAGYLHALENNNPELIISDHSLYNFDSVMALELLKETKLNIPFILVTGTVSEEFAVSILKMGADDYILKSNYTRLSIAIKSALNAKSAQREKQIFIEQLEASEKHYRQLFQGNPLPMWILTNNNYQFLDVNTAALKHYGYKKEEFLNMTAVDLRPYTEKEQFLTHKRQTNVGPHSAGVWRHQKKDNSLIWVDITVNNIDYHGKKALLILAKDVTERIEYAKALEELLFFTSHKVRQPVAHILGICNLIEQDLVTGDELLKILSIYKNSALALDDFTKELTVRLNELKLKSNT
jgi:PAS domain S-box-containing protein